MRLETAQVLELLGLSKETLRHWKKVLPPVEGRDGRSAGYTFNEVIALALIASAVRDLQVPISRFSPVAYRIFQEIGSHVEDANTTTVLCVTLGDVALYPIDMLPSDPTLMLVRLAPTIRRLRQRLAPEPASDRQLSLDLDVARDDRSAYRDTPAAFAAPPANPDYDKRRTARSRQHSAASPRQASSPSTSRSSRSRSLKSSL